MIIPVRCFTCGKILGDKWTYYKTELDKLGLRVIKKAWNSIDFNWSQTKFAIFRSTWDYFDKFRDFKTWVASI